MDSRLRFAAAAVGAAAASGLLFFFGTGLHPVWWFTWLAPLPLLLLAPRAPAWGAAAAAFVAFLAGETNLVTYARAIIPVPVIALMLTVPALVFAGCVLWFRWYARRGRPIPAVLGFAALWVAFEYLSELRSPHSTFGNLAYTQMDCLPVLQVVSLTGIWSVSFLVFLLPAAIAAPASMARASRTVATATLVLCAAVLCFGFARLHSGPRGPLVRLGLIDTDAAGRIDPHGPDAVNLVRDYAGQMPELAREGAQVVVIPEKIGRFTEDEVAEADGILKRAASENHVTIVAGLLHLPNLNESRVYAPESGLEATYEKHHMLPPFESDLVPGTARVLLRRSSGAWGLTICKDMDFPLLSRQYAVDGAGLLLVPAWDFVADGWLHGRMAILRGVESGFSIARAAKQGVLTVSDDRGRVLAERTTGPAGFATLVADVPVENDVTLYDRAGDWFAWFDLGLAAVLLILMVRELAGRRLSG